MINMSSRSSSLSSAQSKYSSSSYSSRTSNACSNDADEHRSEILEPNNILVEEVLMDQDRWSSLAFSLGMPVQSGESFISEAQKLASRMSRRKNLTATHIVGYLRPFLEAVVADCPGVSLLTRCVYHGDAVPTHEVLKNTIHRLPIPNPTLSLGYSGDVFSRHHVELQDGIITGPDEEPYNLKHISQPMVDHFWPFFVVEISEKSMLSALQANAVTAATCNNALNILATAVTTDNESPTASFKFDANIARTFSLSISGKDACLSFHGAQGNAPFVATPFTTYRLDKMSDVASLADRIHSIMLWSRHKRFPEISATLDALDRRVYGRRSSSAASIASSDDFDPAYLKTRTLKSSRRVAGSDRIKVALKASLPRWLG